MKAHPIRMRSALTVNTAAADATADVEYSVLVAYA
jgi:hypothetical protein